MTPTIITVHGVLDVDSGTNTDVCPCCGAAAADAPSMLEIGVIVFGLACTWNIHSGVFRCSMPVQLPAQRDGELVRARLRGICDRFKPTPDSDFGSATITREDFLDCITRDGMRDAIKYQVQR